MANRFGRNSGNGNVAWMDVVKLTCVIEVLLEVVLVICDTKVTSADELIMKGVDLIWSNLANN